MAGVTTSHITIVPNQIPDDARGTVLPEEFGCPGQYFHAALALALQDIAFSERTIPERAVSNQRQVEMLRSLSPRVAQVLEQNRSVDNDSAQTSPCISSRKEPPYFARVIERVDEHQQQEQTVSDSPRGFSRVVTSQDYQRSSAIQYQLLYAGYRDFILHHADINLLEQTAPFYEDTMRVVNGVLEAVAESERKQWDFENVPEFIPEEDRRSFSVFCREVQACAYWKTYQRVDQLGISPDKRTLEKSFLISFRSMEEARKLYDQLAKYDGLFAEFSGNAAYIEELKYSTYDLAFFESFLTILEPRLRELYAHHVGGDPADVVVGEYTHCCVYAGENTSQRLHVREGLPSAGDTLLIAGILDHLWLLSGDEISQVLSDLAERFPDVRFAAVDSGSTRRRALFSSRISRTECISRDDEQHKGEPSLGEQLESDVQSHRGTVAAFIRQTGERTLRFLDRFPGQRLDERLPTPQMEVPDGTTPRSVTSAHRLSFLMPVGPAASQWPLDKLKYEILLSKVKDRLLYRVLVPLADELIRDTKESLTRPGDVSTVSRAALHDVLGLFSLPGSGVVSPHLLAEGERSTALRGRAVNLLQRVWSDSDLVRDLRILSRARAQGIDPSRFEILNDEILRGQALCENVKSLLSPSQVKLHDFLSGLCFSFEPFLKQYLREQTQDEWHEFRPADRRNSVTALLSLRDPLTKTGTVTTPEQEIHEILRYWCSVVTLYQTIVMIAEKGSTADETTLLDLAVRLDEAITPFFGQATSVAEVTRRQRFLDYFVQIDEDNVLVPRFKVTQVELLLAELREYTRRNGQRVASALVDSLIIDGNSVPLALDQSCQELAEILLTRETGQELPPEVEHAFYRALSFPPEVLEFESPLLRSCREFLKSGEILDYDPMLLLRQKVWADELAQQIRAIPQTATSVTLTSYLQDAPAMHVDFGRVLLQIKFERLQALHRTAVERHRKQFAEILAEELDPSSVDMRNFNGCKLLDSLRVVMDGLMARAIAYKVAIKDFTDATRNAGDMGIMLTRLTGPVVERWQQMKGVRAAIYDLLNHAPFQELSEQVVRIVSIFEHQPFPETVDPAQLSIIARGTITQLNNVMCRGLPHSLTSYDNLVAFAPESESDVVIYERSREVDPTLASALSRHLLSVEEEMTSALIEFDRISSGSPFWSDLRQQIAEVMELLKNQERQLTGSPTLSQVLRMVELAKCFYGDGWAMWEGVGTAAQYDIHDLKILEFLQTQSESLQRILTEAFVNCLAIHDPVSHHVGERSRSPSLKAQCQSFRRTLETTERIVAKLAKPVTLSSRKEGS